MTPDELAAALEAIGFAPDIAHRPFPEIAKGADAEAKDFHLVHHPDGRVSVEGPDDRSNKTRIEYWHGEPAIFDTADEARAMIFRLIKRTEEIYGERDFRRP